MSKWKNVLMAGATVLAIGGLLSTQPSVRSYAAGFFTNGVPVAGGTQYPSTLPLTGNETIPADTNLSSGLNPASEAITTTQLQGLIGQQAGSGGWRNALIGGDLGTNLWQRGTTTTLIGAVSNSVTYGPDRFAALGGASSSIWMSKQTGASDILTGYTASVRFQRAPANTDTTAIQFGQEVLSANSTRFQGQKTEFVFHALEGANFSGASSQFTAKIVYGTGTDEGTAAMFAGTWTGYTAISGTITGSTSWGKYSVVGTVPSTATEVGVIVTYTPVGTAGANDWLELTGMQLDVNPAAVASTVMSSFERRPSNIEAQLQYAYYWQLNEVASSSAIPHGTGLFISTTSAQVDVPFPTVMRSVPTMAYTAGFGATTSAGTYGACSALASVSNGVSVQGVALRCGTTAGSQGNGTVFVDDGGTGVIKANSEL